MGDVARRVGAAGWNVCVVLDEHSVVLGLLDGQALGGDPARIAEEVMRGAPSPWRPHLTAEEIAETLKRQDRDHVLVTTSDGRLAGLRRREDPERRVADLRARRAPVSR